MAYYLRDQHVKNIALDAEALKQINSVFLDRFTQLQAQLLSSGKTVVFSYVIRFDNKGYRVFSLEELLLYFNLAHTVERVVFSVESSDALSSGRVVGAYLDLCIDTQDAARCSLVSSSDNKDWAEASFAAVLDVLNKHKTRYGLARSPWVSLLIQLLGVIIGFVVSFWLAYKISSQILIENGFFLSFLFVLLVFSNVWGYLNQLLLSSVYRLFPNINFIRPKKAHLHWLLQALVGSAAFGSVVYFLGVAFSYLTEVLSGIFKSS